MTVSSAVSRAAVLPLTVEGLQREAAVRLPSIAKDAGPRDRDRILPREQVAAVAAGRFAALRVPQALGGAGGSVRDVIAFLIDLSAADPNVAQAVRASFVITEALLSGEDDGHARLWLSRVAAGELIGTANVELGGKHGAIATRIARDEEDFVVIGRKYYCTGALYADWVAGTAINDEGRLVSFIVPRDRAGLELVDDFDAMGQRLTASGTTIFDNVRVHADEITVRDLDKRSVAVTFGQLYLAAMQAGIARNIRDDAIDFASNHARAIKHSSAETARQDPYIRLSVGQLASHAFTAEAAVLHAADVMDAAWAKGLTREALTEAAIAVANAQLAVTDIALKAGETLFDTGSASATSRKHNFDRHWRNARTIANHNPRQWKAAVIGGYLLEGEEPPAKGYF